MNISPANYFGQKETNWWSQETQAIFGLCYPWMLGLAKIGEIFGKSYGVVSVPFENDYGWHFMDKKLSIELAKHVITNYSKNKSYIKNIIIKWKQQRHRLLNTFSRIDKLNFSKLTAKQLWQEYNSLFINYCGEFSGPLIAEAFEPFTSDIFLKQFDKLSKQDAQYLAVLSAPKFKSFLTAYQEDLLKVGLQILLNKKLSSLFKSDVATELINAELCKRYTKLYKLITTLSKKYFWISNNYKNIQQLNNQDFIKILKLEIKNKNAVEMEQAISKINTITKDAKSEAKKAIRMLKLSNRNRAIFDLFDLIAPWHDERKRLMMIAGYYVYRILLAIGTKIGVKLEELYYYTPKEINKLLISKIKLKYNLATSRRKYSVWVGKGKWDAWYTGEDAKQIRALLFNKKEMESNLISGVAASQGFAAGVARVVLDALNDDFKKGEILVAAMTRPEFLPLMKKARAIVTNEGGLTCHAAIVSRELGIPCVVGTRVATKIIKTGDLLEVRAHRGEVKIIKKA